MKKLDYLLILLLLVIPNFELLYIHAHQAIQIGVVFPVCDLLKTCRQMAKGLLDVSGAEPPSEKKYQKLGDFGRASEGAQTAHDTIAGFLCRPFDVAH